MFDWFTLNWFLDNLIWFIVFMIISAIILLLFPVILSYDLYKKNNRID